MDAHQLVDVVGAVVTVASLVANIIPPSGWVGRILHFLALNGPSIQSAVKSAADKR